MLWETWITLDKLQHSFYALCLSFFLFVCNILKHVPSYFSCLGGISNTVLLWSSRSALWSNFTWLSITISLDKKKKSDSSQHRCSVWVVETTGACEGPEKWCRGCSLSVGQVMTCFVSLGFAIFIKYVRFANLATFVARISPTLTLASLCVVFSQSGLFWKSNQMLFVIPALYFLSALC